MCATTCVHCHLRLSRPHLDRTYYKRYNRYQCFKALSKFIFWASGPGYGTAPRTPPKIAVNPTRWPLNPNKTQDFVKSSAEVFRNHVLGGDLLPPAQLGAGVVQHAIWPTCLRTSSLPPSGVSSSGHWPKAFFLADASSVGATKYFLGGKNIQTNKRGQKLRFVNIINGQVLTRSDVSFYNSTASTWTLATPRTTWESNEV